MSIKFDYVFNNMSWDNDLLLHISIDHLLFIYPYCQSFFKLITLGFILTALFALGTWKVCKIVLIYKYGQTINWICWYCFLQIHVSCFHKTWKQGTNDSYFSIKGLKLYEFTIFVWLNMLSLMHVFKFFVVEHPEVFLLQ